MAQDAADAGFSPGGVDAGRHDHLLADRKPVVAIEGRAIGAIPKHDVLRRGIEEGLAESEIDVSLVVSTRQARHRITIAIQGIGSIEHAHIGHEMGGARQPAPELIALVGSYRHQFQRGLVGGNTGVGGSGEQGQQQQWPTEG